MTNESERGSAAIFLESFQGGVPNPSVVAPFLDRDENRCRFHRPHGGGGMKTIHHVIKDSGSYFCVECKAWVDHTNQNMVAPR